MGKPTAQEIANAPGITSNQVSPLAKRGMPVHKIKKAQEWFEKNGFDSVHHGKSGGAVSRSSMENTINAAIGSSLVMPLTYVMGHKQHET